MPRTNDQVRTALAATELVSAVLIKIGAFGCSDDQYTDESSCTTNGNTWKGATLLTDFDTDIPADTGSGTETFKATSQLSDIPEFEEELGIEVDSLAIDLIAIDNDWINAVQLYDPYYVDVSIHRVLLDPEDFTIIGSPISLFTGFITKANIVKDEIGGSMVQLEVSNTYYDYDRTNGIVCNVDSHQAASDTYSSDTGFLFCDGVERKLPWMDS